ncbi:MAG: hypothetical protein JXR30_00850 [Alphaproteobacteria bacterium]|nr:hypothetical protein [Alphaproteobacteria bacterium]
MKRPYALEALIAYIGNEKKAEIFDHIFSKIDQNKFALIWSWPGFLAGFWYLFYRRAFLYGAIWFAFFFLLPIPFDCKIILSSLLGGLLTPHILRHQYLTVKENIEKRHEEKSERLTLLKERGGRNRWAIYVPIVFSVVFLWASRPYIGLFMELNKKETFAQKSELIVDFIQERTPSFSQEKADELEKRLTVLMEKSHKKEISNTDAEKEIQELIDVILTEMRKK